jgi:hypothetical protein
VRSEIPISDHPPKVFPPPKPFLALFVRARSVASNSTSSSSQLAHLCLRSGVWLVPRSLFSKHEPRALSTEVVRSWAVPSRRCRSAPSSLLVASLPALARWLLGSRSEAARFSARPQGLLPRRSPLRSHLLPGFDRPILPWAFSLLVRDAPPSGSVRPPDRSQPSPSLPLVPLPRSGR